MARKEIIASDLGTPALSRHYQLKVELVGQTNVKPRVRVMDQTTLDRLFVRKILTDDQHLAGLRLHDLAYRAGISASILSNLYAAVRVRASSEGFEGRATEARERVRRALAYVARNLSSKAASALVGIVVTDQTVSEWSREANLHRSKGMRLLKESLNWLVRYWESEGR